MFDNFHGNNTMTDNGIDDTDNNILTKKIAYFNIPYIKTSQNDSVLVSKTWIYVWLTRE